MYILSHIYLVFNYVFILVWVRYLFYMLGYSPVLLYFVAQIIASLTIPRSFQFSSITQSCLTLSDSTDCSSPVFPVRHQLPEPTHTHVHWAGDAIQAPLVGFIVLLRIHIIVFLSFFFFKGTFSLSETTICSRLILCIFCSHSRIGLSPKES